MLILVISLESLFVSMYLTELGKQYSMFFIVLNVYLFVIIIVILALFVCFNSICSTHQDYLCAIYKFTTGGPQLILRTRDICRWCLVLRGNDMV
jgi:beta-xylosidase